MYAQLSVSYEEHKRKLSNYTCGDAISAVFNLTEVIKDYLELKAKEKLIVV